MGKIVKGSPRFALAWSDVRDVLVHAGFAALSGLLAWLASDLLPRLDQTTTGGILLFGLLSTLMKVARVLIPDTRAKP